jgi:hypothetical protein
VSWIGGEEGKQSISFLLSVVMNENYYLLLSNISVVMQTTNTNTTNFICAKHRALLRSHVYACCLSRQMKSKLRILNDWDFDSYCDVSCFGGITIVV